MIIASAIPRLYFNRITARLAAVKRRIGHPCRFSSFSVHAIGGQQGPA
jgi:hypothetical protein